MPDLLVEFNEVKELEEQIEAMKSKQAKDTCLSSLNKVEAITKDFKHAKKF